MKKKLLWLFFGLTLFMANSANSARYTGKVSKIWIEPSAGEFVMLVMDNAPERDDGDCSVNEVYHYAFRLEGNMGAAMLAIALTAYTSQKEIRVHGSGSCSLYSTVETVENLRIQ